ncbi:MAG: alpha-L-fucosidase [Oscillospiraceae bacterium]|jgi:hypothetical protein|nr:alpha-L-fucosidase [Oscillospiraceae bacterium]
MRPGWHNTNYRRNLVDMHIEGWNPEFMASFDPEAYVDNLKRAGVTCAMVYANSHVGLCYWPSAFGNAHPGLKGRDIFGEVAGLCHKNGMDVILYYSVIYDNWAYDRNADWRLINAEGIASRQHKGGGSWTDRSGRYGLLCPNSQGYRGYIEAQLKDLAERYDFESVFFDMTFWPEVCYCPNCRGRFEREVGGGMPTVIDWSDDRWNAFQSRRELWLREFALFCSDTVKRHKPGVTANHQYSTITANWALGVTEGHTDACDYVGGDFYAGPTEQGIICKLFNSLCGSYEFHTSRCLSLHDHTTMKSPEMIHLQSRVALAHKGAFLFIDAVDPAGTLNPAVYDLVAPTFRGFARYEKYLGGEIAADVAVLFDTNSKMDYAENGKTAVGMAWKGYPHKDCMVGAAQALKERHIPYTVIGCRNIKNAIGRYKVIVLPGVLRLPDEAARDLKEYIRRGGAVYASGFSGLANLSDALGLEDLGETEQTVTYMAPTEKGVSIFAGATAEYPLTVMGRQRVVKALPGAEVYATITLPYTDPGDNSRFASIHSNPPGIPTGHPAMVVNHYGKGKTAYMAASIERRGEKAQSDAFIAAIDLLSGGSYSVELDAPPAIEAIVFADQAMMNISLLNTQTTLPPVKAHGVRVAASLSGRRVEDVLLLPDETPIPFTEQDGKVSFEAPPLDLFCMIRVALRPGAGGE